MTLALVAVSFDILRYLRRNIQDDKRHGAITFHGAAQQLRFVDGHGDDQH
ncbi:hypothetical protein [Pendulispora albinea]|uniref:Uncharacterized protein n=1 Tax=Pendulispora albinea TaxID=2741071 RepID=A0ABZ2LQL4_9BACT